MLQATITLYENGDKTESAKASEEQRGMHKAYRRNFNLNRLLFQGCVSRKMASVTPTY